MVILYTYTMLYHDMPHDVVLCHTMLCYYHTTITPEGQIANALYQVEDYLRQSKQPVARVITTEAERSQLEAIGRLPWNASSDAQMNATFIIEENGTFDLRYLTGFRIRGTTSRVLNPKNRRVNVTSDNTWRGRASIIFNAVNLLLYSLLCLLFFDETNS